jgi:hypothetical protein
MPKHEMTQIDGCQIPGIPRMAEEEITSESRSLIHHVKRAFAVPWNYYVKRWLKKGYHLAVDKRAQNNPRVILEPLKVGDQVRVRTWEEIQATLDPFKELKGCAFLAEMKQFCGTTQRVFQVMERFLDERDYKVKKVKGVVLLEGVICRGTPVFGRCDRSCLLFWREEWLEKI